MMQSAVDAQVVEFELKQTLSLRGNSPVWNERYQARVSITSDAITSGWLKTNFPGAKGKSDFAVLIAIAMHARPLDDEDLDLLISLMMASQEDRFRLYARVTDLCIGDEIDMDRKLVAASAERLAGKGFISILDIPKELLKNGQFRDSHGRFEGSKVYLLAGDIFSGFQKTVTTRDSGPHTDPADRGANHPTVKMSDPSRGVNHPTVKNNNSHRGANHPTAEASKTGQIPATVGQITSDCGANQPINESFKESLKLIESGDVSSSDSSQDSLNGPETEIIQAMITAGVYPETATKLAGDFPHDLIQAWLELLPAAMEVGFATSPGWIPTVLRRKFDLDRARINIARKQAELHPNPPEPVNEEDMVPDDVIEDLRAIGWTDNMTLIERCWKEDYERVDAWIAYIVKVFDELNNPAGRLRYGLESGQYPPKERKRWQADLPSATRHRNDPYANYYA